MSFEWNSTEFKSDVDAYLDWISFPGSRFPPGFEEYPLPVSVFQQFRPEYLTSGFPKDGLGSGGLFASIFASAFPFGEPIQLGSAGGGGSGAVASFFLGDQSTTELPFDLKGFGDDDFVYLADNSKTDPLRNTAGRTLFARPLPADAVGRSNSLSLGFFPHSHAAKTGDEADGHVIIGIIDEGIAFGHERFRKGLTESRVDSVWLQDAPYREDGYLPYGKQIDQDEIDQLLRNSTQGSYLDEDKFYSLAAAADFSRAGHKANARRVAHGTHVMDTAAGFPMGPEGEKWHIICVQLPSATVAETSGLGLERYFLDGIQFIERRATSIAEKLGKKEMPLVINFSSGVRAGPRDGTSLIEQFLDEFIRHRRRVGEAPTQIVLPAGNSYQSRSHARFVLSPNEQQSVTWRVLPDDKTFSYIEVWLDKAIDLTSKKTVALRVTTPDGTESEWLVGVEQEKNLSDYLASVTGSVEGESGVFEEATGAVDLSNLLVLSPKGDLGTPICKVYFQSVESNFFSKDETKKRGRFLICLLPTMLDDAPMKLAPHGDWTIAVRNDSAINARMDAWIHWDDSPLSYIRTGRQSYFTDDTYQRYDSTTGKEIDFDKSNSVVRRAGTMNAIATGREPVVVGGYVEATEEPARYTAADFDGKGAENAKPLVSAVCEVSNVLPGILGAGTRSGSRVVMNGTSVAAPQIARKIAEWMAAGEDDAKITERLRTLDGLPLEEPATDSTTESRNAALFEPEQPTSRLGQRRARDPNQESRRRTEDLSGPESSVVRDQRS